MHYRTMESLSVNEIESVLINNSLFEAFEIAKL